MNRYDEDEDDEEDVDDDELDDEDDGDLNLKMEKAITIMGIVAAVVIVIIIIVIVVNLFGGIKSKKQSDTGDVAHRDYTDREPERGYGYRSGFPWHDICGCADRGGEEGIKAGE